MNALTLPPQELDTRARNAILARRLHLLALLRHLLQTLRRDLSTHPSADARYTALSHVLALSRLSHDHHYSLPLLPLPPRLRLRLPLPLHLPPPGVPSPQKHQPPRAFQTRTFLHGAPIDERRTPAAPWPLPPAHHPRSSSLSVMAASSASLSTLTSSGTVPSAPPSRIASCRSLHAYGYGYSAFRVEAGPTVRKGLSAKGRAEKQGVEEEEEEEEGGADGAFFRPDADLVREIRLRDCVFEIGLDGRIRRQKSGGFG